MIGEFILDPAFGEQFARDGFAFTPLWCPLVDVDGSNGALAIVPGRHRVASRVRPNVPNGLYYSPVAALHDAFRKRYLRELPMKAGGALLYEGGDDAWVAPECIGHGSGRRRRGDGSGAHAVASLLDASRTKVEVFAVEDGFYRSEVALGSRPSGTTPVDVLAFASEEPPMTEANFLARTADVVRDPGLSIGAATS